MRNPQRRQWLDHEAPRVPRQPLNPLQIALTVLTLLAAVGAVAISWMVGAAIVKLTQWIAS